MKKIVVFLTMALMVLSSVSCTKKMVPLYLKGTTWVSNETGDLAVIKFDTRRTFHIDIYGDNELELTVKYKVAEVIDDQVNFEFLSSSMVDVEVDIPEEGMLQLQSRREMDIVFTSQHWTKINEDTRSHLFRDDQFDISKYIN